MVRSMTGFGKVTKQFEHFDIAVEIKSVNSKYLDPSFKLPKNLSSLEITLRPILQESLARGKVDIRIETVMKTSPSIPHLNKELIGYYKNILNELREFGTKNEEIKIEHFLSLPSLIEFSADECIEGEMSLKATETVSECLEILNKMRITEGESLEKDIRGRINNLKTNLKIVENAKGGIYEYWLDKFKKRMQELQINNIDEERIVQEASMYGEKADISEEITRLNSHLNQFENIMSNEFPIGKKLDFLCQEIHRELNTIASKSTKTEIINAIVESKAEADRIREQIQNLI